MEILPRLPVRETPLPGESLSSLVRRTAAAMGYEAVSRVTGLVGQERCSSHRLDEFEPRQLESLACLLGRRVEDLRPLTIHRWAASLVLTADGLAPKDHCDSKTALRFFRTAAPRLCGHCLGETPAYGRLSWSFRALPICTRHRIWLRGDCPNCRRIPRPTRLEIARCNCGFDLRMADCELADEPIVALSRSLETWLDGERPIPALSSGATWLWIERLKVAIDQTPPWVEQLRLKWNLPEEFGKETVGWLGAAELLLEWPNRLLEFLDEFQKVDKPTKLKTGISRAFGRFLRDASRLEQLGYAAPADVLRSYLLKRFTRGHLNGKVCLFHGPRHRSLIDGRMWLTQTKAAGELQIRASSIADLVRRGLLEGHFHAAGRRTLGLVSRASAKALKQRLDASCSLAEASQELGIERHRLVELMAADILPGCVRGIDGWRIPRDAVEQLLRFTGELPVRQGGTWITARQATRKYGRRGLTFATLLKWGQENSVQLSRESASLGFRHLRVEGQGLVAALDRLTHARDVQQGYPLSRLRVLLVPGQRFKETVLRKWIKAGLLRASRTCQRWSVMPAEIERFQTTYCLAPEFCRSLAISRATLVRWEREGRVTAVYGRRNSTGAGASVYWRADLERLRLGRSAAA